MEYKDFIISSLEDAAKIANNYFGKVSGITKEGDNNQVLTQADVEVGKLLVANVEKAFPDHNIIDEEAGVIDKNSHFTWVIDPIDGTSNFANGIPTYGIMIGLLENNQPIAGGIALPYFKEVYFAEKEKGAFCNDERISITKETDLSKVLVAYGIDGHQENPQLTYDEMPTLAEIVLHIRNLRDTNSVFDFMQVAKGSYGGAIYKSSKIWDNIAPHIIIEEAGGIFTDFYGKPMDYTNPLKKAKDNFTGCAASPILHKELQKVIHNNPDKIQTE